MARKRKLSTLKTVAVTILALCLMSVAVYYLIKFFTKAAHVKYPAFGINIPLGYAIHGIDVSRYQRVIDWSDVKNMQVKDIKIGFAFIKATEGIGKIDAQFRRNWLKAADEKIPKGAYHYFIAGESGKAQAQNFIDIVKLEKGDLPPVLDVEQSNRTGIDDLRKEVLVWLNKIEQEYKTKPVIYTNIYFYNRYLSTGFDDYPFWIAHYLQPAKPRLSRNWLFWQHSESGHVNGIGPPVDFNVFAGDSLEFDNLLLK
ncbi:MAG: GH25 family lysozyme [Ginsengibacter sp.]